MNLKRWLVFVTVVVCVGLLSGLTVTAAEEESQLRMVVAFPTHIDPAVGNSYSCARALTMIHDQLVYPDTSSSPQPHAATDWEVSSDGLEWTFQLRPGIEFHNGNELTAEDVKFSMDRFVTIAEGYSYLFTDTVKETEVVDKYTVKFHLNSPYGVFLTALFKFGILNKDAVMEHLVTPGPYGEYGDYGREWLTTHDAASGPYKVEDYQVSELLTLKKVEDYWGEIRPKAPTYVYMIPWAEPVTLRTMLARREVEMSDQWQGPETLAGLDTIEGVDICSFATGGVFDFMIHTRKSPTDDIHFRKAMCYATDYETIANDIFPGFPITANPIPSQVAGYDPNVQGYHYDLDKAREELQKSKYYDQLDQYTIEIAWDVPIKERIALLLQSDFAKIGIKAEIVKYPYMWFVQNMSDMEASQHIISMYTQGDFPEAGGIYKSRYVSGSANTVFQNEWLLDPVFDQMLADSLAIADRDERLATYSAMQQYLVDRATTLWMVAEVFQAAYQAAYMDWPVARGEGIAFLGFDTDARWIEVYPEKRAELLGQ